MSTGDLTSSMENLMPAITEEPAPEVNNDNNNDTVRRRSKDGPTKPRPKSLNFEILSLK